MRLLSIFAQFFLTGVLMMAQGQPIPDWVDPGQEQSRRDARF